MKRLLTILVLSVLWLSAAAQSSREPLYIVNGVIRSSVSDIEEENIEKIETIPADEQSVSQYGPQANNGVVIITLCYDVEPLFLQGESFSEYISQNVEWKPHFPAARFVMRYTVEKDGSVTRGSILQSTDARFRKRVLAAFDEAPKWQPATKEGVAVSSEHLLVVQLPKDKPLPREPYIVIR